MKKNKGFTLIELMVVILIVAILAAVLAPMMTGRIADAKWTEGKTAAGTIATAIRAFIAENEGTSAGNVSIAGTMTDFTPIGITAADLAGKYFTAANYSASITATTAGQAPIYTITITNAALSSDTWQLDQNGTWTKTSGGN